MEMLVALTAAFCTFFELEPSISSVDIPMIMYHHLEENEEELNEFTVTPQKFENDMEEIRDLGFETISYKQLYDFVNHAGNLPKKPIIITFDDGYESNYKYAFPILKEMNMKATIAIIGNMVGTDIYRGKQVYRHFTYEEAKEMYDSGVIDIQTHTFDLHDISKRVGIKRKNGESADSYISLVKNDIKKAALEIEKKVGNKQFVFTYPYGAYDYLTEKIVQELGFTITVTTDPGVNHIVRGEKSTLLGLKRFDIKNDTDIETLLTVRFNAIVNSHLLLTNWAFLI